MLLIVFNERQLRRVLREYFEYYHGSRTHLGIEKECPVPRRIDPPPRTGPIDYEPLGPRRPSQQPLFLQVPGAYP